MENFISRISNSLNCLTEEAAVISYVMDVDPDTNTFHSFHSSDIDIDTDVDDVGWLVGAMLAQRLGIPDDDFYVRYGRHQMDPTITATIDDEVVCRVMAFAFGNIMEDSVYAIVISGHSIKLVEVVFIDIEHNGGDYDGWVGSMERALIQVFGGNVHIEVRWQ